MIINKVIKYTLLFDHTLFCYAMIVTCIHLIFLLSHSSLTIVFDLWLLVVAVCYAFIVGNAAVCARANVFQFFALNLINSFLQFGRVSRYSRSKSVSFNYTDQFFPLSLEQYQIRRLLIPTFSILFRIFRILYCNITINHELLRIKGRDEECNF